MKNSLIPALLAAFIMLTSCKQQITVNYPVTKKVDTVDSYFGKKIADPYRWLENDTSAATASWVKAENEVTTRYLSQIPFREKIRERLTKMWNYPRFGVPFKQGPYLFHFKNDGLQNQSVLYVREGLNGVVRTLLDPNKLSADGTIALAGTSVSHDGKYLAYSIAKSGSDWNEIHVMEIATGRQLPDTLKWVKFSGMSWKDDGFYYSRYDEPKKGLELSKKNEFHKVFFHKVGTEQRNDLLIYQNKQFPLHNYSASTTEDERFLILYESESTSGNSLYYCDLNKKSSSFTQIAEGFDFEYSVIDNMGDKLLVITNNKAPKKKLVLVDPASPDPKAWKTLIPEREDVLETVHMAGDLLISVYMQNAISKAFVYNLGGTFLHEMSLPGIGTLAGFNGKKGENVAFFGYTSFTYPLTVFKYDVGKNSASVYTRPNIDFNPDDYEVKQVFYSSKDKTTIPMFLVHKKGLEINGKNPTLLYGYGGFNISLTPNFSLSRLIFLENGGVYAVANIRGGGRIWRRVAQSRNQGTKTKCF